MFLQCHSDVFFQRRKKLLHLLAVLRSPKRDTLRLILRWARRRQSALTSVEFSDCASLYSTSRCHETEPFLSFVRQTLTPSILFRSVKRETLRLIETFVEKAEDTEIIAKQFVPAMLDPILGDYARNVPDARESEVLSLFAAIINK
jgi:hypothetical protein